jgi:hypothetical protein
MTDEEADRIGTLARKALTEVLDEIDALNREFWSAELADAQRIQTASGLWKNRK